MKIRSITYFLNPRWPVSELSLRKAGIFGQQARAVFEQLGYEVQTQRLATPSFTTYLFPEDYEKAANQIEVLAHSEGFDYVALGPALPSQIDSYHAIPKMLRRSGNLFFSGHMNTPDKKISLPAVQACAEIIHQAAPIENGGFANLRFCALANVDPGSPFFPAAYHQGKDPAFGLAIEGADLAVEAFTAASSLEEARNNLLNAIHIHTSRLEQAAQQLEHTYNIPFKGIDFSMAPFPTQSISMGYALESLGLAAFGLSGSLAAAAFLTDTLDQAKFKRTGFNGLMLPFLEDSSLAKRGTEGVLSVTDLLLYSAVCGTGLDTIPLPGDVSIEQIYAVLLDVAALAMRLNKPLTARLMPIPGKKVGDETGFDFEFFANSRVLDLPAQPLHGLLTGNEIIEINPRKNL
jgi:uncharacterized protein (UPF0210 family)